MFQFSGFLIPYFVGLLTPNVRHIFIHFRTLNDNQLFQFRLNCSSHRRYYLSGAWYFGAHSVFTSLKPSYSHYLAVRKFNHGMHPNNNESISFYNNNKSIIHATGLWDSGNLTHKFSMQVLSDKEPFLSLLCNKLDFAMCARARGRTDKIQ